MGVIWRFFDSEIKRFEQNLLRRCEYALKTVVKDVTKEIRDEIVREWFGDCNSSSTESATHYDVEVHGARLEGSKSVTAICHHKVVPGEFAPSSSTVAAWEGRNGHPSLGGDLWILDLLMNKGIIGLPAYFSWVQRPNPNFIQRGQTLENATLTGAQWSRWAGEVASRLGL